MKKSQQNALTLMEILVSLVILALVFLGLLNLFISGRKYLRHSQSIMAGSELGKVFLDPLQMQVREDTWDKGMAVNTLTVGNYLPVSYPDPINGITYTATTVVTAVNDGLRRVQTKISWEEH
ncbi:MAG: prepilin-type N-terminal cleavage/methylation domain-containing protein [Candidatus Omnitrophota bacterium]